LLKFGGLKVMPTPLADNQITTQDTYQPVCEFDTPSFYTRLTIQLFEGDLNVDTGVLTGVHNAQYKLSASNVSGSGTLKALVSDVALAAGGVEYEELLTGWAHVVVYAKSASAGQAAKVRCVVTGT
jgi:hypothetical protein